MRTIAENLQIIKDSTDAIKQAIIDKGGTISGGIATYADAINNISGGGGSEALDNDVNFYDYDGTLLYSYSKNEFLQMSSLPELPKRDGLICQEWNWSCEDAKDYVSEYGVLDIGATYITDDGKTRLYLNIPTDGRMNVPLCFTQTVSDGVTIDWGDGSQIQTFSGTGGQRPTHSYKEKGDYVITFDVTEGCVLTLGFGGDMGIFGDTSGNGNVPSVYANMVTKLEIGARTSWNAPFVRSSSIINITLPKGITLNRMFTYSNVLSFIVLPAGVNEIISSWCESMTSLRKVVIPKSVKRINTKAFYNCSALSRIIIPEGCEIGGSAFYNCAGLGAVVIPKNAKPIGNSIFYNSGAKYIDLSRNTSVASHYFIANNCATDLKYIVPDALYDEWIAATNWSNVASYIIKKSDWDAQNN